MAAAAEEDGARRARMLASARGRLRRGGGCGSEGPPLSIEREVEGLARRAGGKREGRAKGEARAYGKSSPEWRGLRVCTSAFRQRARPGV